MDSNFTGSGTVNVGLNENSNNRVTFKLNVLHGEAVDMEDYYPDSVINAKTGMETGTGASAQAGIKMASSTKKSVRLQNSHKSLIRKFIRQPSEEDDPVAELVLGLGGEMRSVPGSSTWNQLLCSYLQLSDSRVQIQDVDRWVNTQSWITSEFYQFGNQNQSQSQRHQGATNNSTGIRAGNSSANNRGNPTSRGRGEEKNQNKETNDAAQQEKVLKESREVEGHIIALGRIFKGSPDYRASLLALETITRNALRVKKKAMLGVPRVELLRRSEGEDQVDSKPGIHFNRDETAGANQGTCESNFCSNGVMSAMDQFVIIDD